MRGVTRKTRLDTIQRPRFSAHDSAPARFSASTFQHQFLKISAWRRTGSGRIFQD